MQIFIKHDKLFVVTVEKSASVGDLKEKIFDRTGIPVDQQSLQGYYKYLEDDKKLYDYNIQNEQTLTLTYNPRGSITVVIKTTGGNTIKHKRSMFASSSICLIKDQIHELEGIPPDQQHLILEKEDASAGHASELKDSRTLSTAHMVFRKAIVLLFDWSQPDTTN